MNNNDIQILIISENNQSAKKIEVALPQPIDLMYKIWNCRDVKKGLDLLRIIKPDIDIILVDLNLMNDMDSIGQEFSRMRHIISKIPIIIFNGSSEHSITILTIEEGATDIISQEQIDVDPNRLIQSIEHSLIRSKIVQNEDRKNVEKIKRMKDMQKKSAIIANDMRVISLKKSRDINISLHKNYEDIFKRNEQKTIQELKDKDQLIAWLCGSYSVNQ